MARACASGTTSRTDELICEVKSSKHESFPVPAQRTAGDKKELTTKRAILNPETFRKVHILGSVVKIAINFLHNFGCALCVTTNARCVQTMRLQLGGLRVSPTSAGPRLGVPKSPRARLDAEENRYRLANLSEDCGYEPGQPTKYTVLPTSAPPFPVIYTL